jgi:hypothetical protein
LGKVPAHEGCGAFEGVLCTLGGIRVSNVERAPENQGIAQIRGDIHAGQRDEPGAGIVRFFSQDPGDLRTELLGNSLRTTRHSSFLELGRLAFTVPARAFVRQVKHLDVHRDDLREMQFLDERNRTFDQ